MTGQTIVLVGVIAYLAFTLLVGFLAGRNVKEGDDFLVAGRRLPTWLCTFTVFATWFGAGTCLGAAGAAYQEGILGVIVDPFGAVLCLVLAGCSLCPRFLVVRSQRTWRSGRYGTRFHHLGGSRALGQKYLPRPGISLIFTRPCRLFRYNRNSEQFDERHSPTAGATN